MGVKISFEKTPKHVIIVAGGKGLRMGSDLPKQFIPVAGLPIIMHTILAFKEAFPDIQVVVVLPLDHQQYWKKIAAEYHFNQPHTIANGGSTRYHSVKSGLEKINLKEQGIIGIHDAVRPLVSISTITQCYQKAYESGNAIPVHAINESIRHVKGNSNTLVNRNEYFAVQTPQVFEANLLDNAYAQDYQESFTDDASVLELLGYPIHLVNGNAENIKITLPIDLKIAELLLKEG